jgi:hypothetical protein
MIDLRCSCGYLPTSDYTLTDHLGEMFIPADDTDAAGQAHAETLPGTCLCGHLAGSPAALDEHLLAAFTPPGIPGRDGRAHVPAGEAPGCATVRA